MPIPDYQTVMLPLLRLFEDGQEHGVREIRDRLGTDLQLSEDELRETVASGKKVKFADRVDWATTYLKHAGVLVSPSRAMYQITPRGQRLLAEGLDRIDNSTLSRFPEFQAFQKTDTPSEVSSCEVEKETATPQEILDREYVRARATTEADLLEQVKTASPVFFESLVVQLLVKMGYGGTLKDAGKAIGRSGDGGIDGIINEDRLGLDVIHVQAKRWGQSSVGRPDVQSFAGSLDGVRAKKGIFITTSTFTADARAYAGKIEKRIILIDGSALAKLMFEFGIGVTPIATYELKRIDADFFTEE